MSVGCYDLAQIGQRLSQTGRYSWERFPDLSRMSSVAVAMPGDRALAASRRTQLINYQIRFPNL